MKAGTLLGVRPRPIRRLIARWCRWATTGSHIEEGKALESADPGAGQAQGAETLGDVIWGLGPDVGAGEVGRAVRDCGERGDATGLAPGEGDDTHFTRGMRPHRTWWELKAHVGEPVQLDGSHHDWFEERGFRCVLMAYIDDSSSRVYARFYAYEGTIPAMESFTRYVTR